MAGGTLASVATLSTGALGSGRLGSGSLSDFVNSFGTAASSMLLGSAVDSTAELADGAAVSIAATAPRPTKQKMANQIVLVIPDT
jgi:hypothetical protein